MKPEEIMKIRYLALCIVLTLTTAFVTGSKLYKAPKSAAAGTPVVVTYKEVLPPSEGNRYWITIIDPTAADSEWGAWVYVEDGATTTTLTAPETPGNYEIRLHGNYPAKSFDVLQRSPLVVK